MNDGTPNLSQLQLHAIIDSVTEGILGLDIDGNHTFVNAAAAAMLGYTPEELIGRNSHAMWHSRRADGTSYPEDECPLHDGLKSGMPVGGEEHFARKDGTVVRVQYSCRPIRDHDGIVGAVITFTEIAERQEQEHELRVLRTALEQSPITAVLTDVNGSIEYVNPQFEKTSGYTATEALGENPRVLKAGDRPDAEYAELWKTIREGRNWRGTFHNRKKSGELYWEDAVISPVTNLDGTITHFLALKQDVTEHREAEERREFQLRFQKVVAEISSLFATVGPDTYDTAIDDALARLGSIFDLGRCFLFRFTDDHRYATNSNEWCAPGVASQLERYTGYPIDEMPWWSRMIERGETLHVPDVNALPADAAQEVAELQAQGVQSCLCIPVKRGDGHLTGFIGFDAIGRTYTWSNDEIRMLTVVVETIAGALERAETTERLQKRETQLRTILDNLTDVVWSLRYPDFAPIFLSPSVEELYGYPVERFQEDPELWQRIVHPDDRGTIDDVMKQLRETGVGERECRIVRPDGAIRWVSDRSHLIYDEQGSPVRIDGIATDITERRRHEEQIRYQNAFQEMIAAVATRFVGVHATNMDALLTDALDRMGTFFEADRSSIVRSSDDLTTATTTHEWFHVPGKYPSSPVRESPLEMTPWYAGKILTERTFIHIPDTNAMPAEAYREQALLQSMGIKSALTVPVYSERHVYGFIGIYTIERYEQWTPEQIRGLSVIAQILAQAFAGIDAENALVALKEESLAAKETAEAANRAKSDFLSSMSHELRTPLNAVLGFAQILEADDTLTPEQTDFTGEILRAGQHLLDLVNEVLDLSKIETGRVDLSLEPVACTEVIHEAISLITPLAESYGVQIAPLVLSHCTIHADRTRLKQILVNILSNAIKYNRPAGSVKIEVLPTDESTDERTVRIAITDTGAGIPEDQIDELFTQFSRLGRERGDIDGTGIGLALTKRLVELMNGSIDVESTIGVGSTFYIDLPATTGASVAPPASPDEGTERIAEATKGDDTPAGRPVVLYIDDNPASVRLMEHIFAKRPELQLLTSHCGSVGLDLAKVHRPAVVVVDINMPDMHGFEVLRRIKASEWGVTTPVVALSANAMDGSAQRGTRAGFDSYVTKPIDVPEFMSILERMISGDSG